MNFNDVMIKQMRYNDTRKNISKDGDLDIIFDSFEENPAHRVVEQFQVDDVPSVLKLRESKRIGIHFISRQRDYGAREIYAISKPSNIINEGDYLRDQNEVWICYSLDTFPLRKNYLSYCNQTLRFVREGEIIDLPCTLSDKTSVYSDGLSKGRRVTLADDQILITIPNNELTRTLRTGERFIFDNSPNAIYRIRRIDFLEREGVMDIRLRHDRYDKHRDNLELGLADYFEDTESSDENDYDDNLYNIQGADTIIKGTSEYYFCDTEKDVKFEVINGMELVELEVFAYNEVKLTAKDKSGVVTLQACIDDEKCENITINIADWW